MSETRFRQVIGLGPAYWGGAVLLVLLVLAGLMAAHRMEELGHIITGMNNQIAWGLPHVFAVFLIVAASGSLNVASVASVFGRVAYKPLARLSGLLAIALLVGGLAILVLDLGRPDRIGVAMTHYNVRSIFAWNILLYTGFITITALYLWVMMEQRLGGHTRSVGTAAFLWRLTLTTGTGSIFGFLVAREAYDAAIMAPLFVAMSLSFGQAIFMLVLMAACRWSGRQLGDVLLQRLKNLLGVLVAAELYFLLAFHLTKLYKAKYHAIEHFLLAGGSPYAALFWFGAVLLGGVLPLVLFYLPALRNSRRAIVAGALGIVAGGLALVYVIIIGGQAYPLTIFPGWRESSSFADGVINPYTPSLPEWLLAVGGTALALLIVLLSVRLLGFLPESLADDPADPGAQG
ncbi:MAG: polysulfide reductase NrfD [Gammaproteobacteria bacterium]|nr:polysulfide reductase NrfD [Gammaproteobacteria bacterium]